uniref:Uncharacterized protein n=1 Tax=Arundo donax TaxID=35708 RepID=A0A0A9CVZ5_ARUDO
MALPPYNKAIGSNFSTWDYFDHIVFLNQPAVNLLLSNNISFLVMYQQCCSFRCKIHQLGDSLRGLSFCQDLKVLSKKDE